MSVIPMLTVSWSQRRKAGRVFIVFVNLLLKMVEELQQSPAT